MKNEQQILLKLKKLLNQKGVYKTLTCSALAIIVSLTLKSEAEALYLPKVPAHILTEDHLYDDKILNIPYKINYNNESNNLPKLKELLRTCFDINSPVYENKALLNNLAKYQINEVSTDTKEIPDSIALISKSNFLNLSIEDQQNYILEHYNLDYKELINAITYAKSYSTDTKEARKIINRSDFDEIKTLFNILTDNKINYVMKRRNLTYDELDVILKTNIGECGFYTYSEGYVNMNSLDNRTHSQIFVNDVNNKFFEGAGYSLYYQIIAPKQYTIYLSGKYKEYVNLKKYSTFYGALDYLVLEESLHNWTSFRSKNNPTGVQLVKDGNKYSYELTDYIDNPTLIYVDNVNYKTVVNLLSKTVIVYKEELENEDLIKTRNKATDIDEIYFNSEEEDNIVRN